DVVKRAGVRGDVLAGGAVAAGRGLDKPAVLVAEREGKAVDLGLGREGEGFVGGEVEETADAGDEVRDLLLGEGVFEREHRHRVPDLGEGGGGGSADP